jgi:hypothetical protein
MTYVPLALDRLSAALGYASRGWHVFPLHSVRPDGSCTCDRADCGSPGKHPATASGFKDATVDASKIRAWWSRHPAANIGIATGASGLCVIDVDGDDGALSLADLESQHGALPAAATVLTGGGGSHVYFRRPDASDVPSSAGRVADNIDVRCDGGYVVAPPSVHASGRLYHWECGSPDDPGTLPDWLARRVISSRRARLDHTPTGSWDDGLVGRAFRHAGLVLRSVDDTRAAVTCPFGDHAPGADTSTVVFAPTAECPDGVWHCSHAHCDGRTQADVLRQLPEGAVRRARTEVAPTPACEVADATSAEDDGPNWTASLVWRSTRRGQVLDAVPGNAILYLSRHHEWAGRLRYDTYLGRARWAAQPPDLPGMARPAAGELLSDAHYAYIHHWFASRPIAQERVNFAGGQLRDAVDAAAMAHSHSSLADWLDTLAWDGTARIHRWLIDYLAANDDPVSRAVGRMWLISAIARAYDPGCQADHVLVLEGGQGVGKSTAAAVLAGEHYLSTMGSISDETRAASALRGRWIVEIGELDAIRGARATQVKDFLTRRTDTFRPAYAHHEQTFRRQCVFIATTNDSQYLQDPTGARRFWPVYVAGLQRDALVRDRDQLWAEAIHLYRAGEYWWPQESIIEMLTEHQTYRREVDPWEPLIQSLVDSRARRVDRHVVLTVNEGLSHCGVEPHLMSKRDANRMAAIYRALGLSPYRMRTQDGCLRAWSLDLHGHGPRG